MILYLLPQISLHPLALRIFKLPPTNQLHLIQLHLSQLIVAELLGKCFSVEHFVAGDGAHGSHVEGEVP